MKIWDASNVRRTLGGLSLVLAPLLFAVVEIAHSSHSTDAAPMLARAARDRALELAYIYFQIASSILFILAFFHYFTSCAIAAWWWPTSRAS